MIELGQKKRFKPSCFLDESRQTIGCPVTVIGTVTYINWAHRWYRVEYEVRSGITLSECFPLPVSPEKRPDYSGHHKAKTSWERVLP